MPYQLLTDPSVCRDKPVAHLNILNIVTNMFGAGFSICVKGPTHLVLCVFSLTDTGAKDGFQKFELFYECSEILQI